MVEKLICAKIHFCAFDELSEAEKLLVNLAKTAAFNAYAPYSGFRVGAALQLEDGQTFTGNNQENAAYPSSLCAERVVTYYANANFPNTAITLLALAANTASGFTRQPVSPCGSCRQSLLESEQRQAKPIRLLLYGEAGVWVVDAISDLLPLRFEADMLQL